MSSRLFQMSQLLLFSDTDTTPVIENRPQKKVAHEDKDITNSHLIRMRYVNGLAPQRLCSLWSAEAWHKYCVKMSDAQINNLFLKYFHNKQYCVT